LHEISFAFVTGFMDRGRGTLRVADDPGKMVSGVAAADGSVRPKTVGTDQVTGLIEPAQPAAQQTGTAGRRERGLADCGVTR
jgi:hypothetical protein